MGRSSHRRRSIVLPSSFSSSLFSPPGSPILPQEETRQIAPETTHASRDAYIENVELASKDARRLGQRGAQLGVGDDGKEVGDGGTELSQEGGWQARGSKAGCLFGTIV